MRAFGKQNDECSLFADDFVCSWTSVVAEIATYANVDMALPVAVGEEVTALAMNAVYNSWGGSVQRETHGMFN